MGRFSPIDWLVGTFCRAEVEPTVVQQISENRTGMVRVDLEATTYFVTISEVPAPPARSSEIWDCDSIQFPRLLSELQAANFDMDALCASMDLPLERIEELFERAMVVWEMHKEAMKDGL